MRKKYFFQQKLLHALYKAEVTQKIKDKDGRPEIKVLKEARGPEIEVLKEDVRKTKSEKPLPEVVQIINACTNVDA